MRKEVLKIWFSVEVLYNFNMNNKILYEKIRLLTSNSLTSSFALFVILSVVISVFWHNSDKSILLAWFLFIAITLIARSVFAKRFLQRSTTTRLQESCILFGTLTIISVLFLSAGITYLFINHGLPYQAFLVIVVAGTSAGAVMSLSFFRYLIKIYLIILITPVVFLLYLHNSEIFRTMSYLVFFFLLMLLFFSEKYYRNISNSLKRKYQILDTKKELDVSNNNFKSFFDEAPIGVFTYNKDLIVTNANKAFANLFQSQLDELIGIDIKTLRDQSLREYLQMVFEGKKGHYQGKYDTHLSKTTIQINLNTVPMYDPEGNIIAGLGLIEDITQEIKYQEQLKYQALYDSLTGLLNRQSLIQHLRQTISKLQRSQEYGAILFIDLDNFKNINDSLGHNVGDLVLKTIALRVKDVLRSEDIIVRLGGDEFVILISQTHKDIEKINKIALYVSQKIHDAMKQPIVFRTDSIYITLSIGIKILNENEKNINTILKHADSAMYQSKNAGKNQTSFYNTSISEKIQEQLVLHNELKIAIEKDQFELYLQPIVDLKTEKIVSAEALIRWNHPKKGVVYPDAFIKYAEENNLIIEIGNWVISRAFEMCKELSCLIEDIAINISLKQFHKEEFTQILMQNSKKYEVEPKHIKLELTESVTLSNMDTTIAKMLVLKSYGFKLSMDDFGTGYSSLSYLKNLPFDYLKIDQSFVLHMLQNQQDETLVKIIIDVAKQFNFLVIAEGVETLENVKFMKDNGCDYYQGYYMSKPIPFNEFKQLF